MRPSSHVVAAASSLAGAFVGAVVALVLGVVHLGPGPTDARSSEESGAAAALPVSSQEEAHGDTGGSGPVPPGEVRERRATVDALQLLHRWDRQRERAWEQGDAALLASLYTPRSGAGRRDVALLERYVARDWAVTGVAPRVHGAELRLRRADRVRLAVTETYPALRVRAPRVPGPGAGGPRREAADPHTRVVTLVRAADAWRVERVTAR